MSIATLDPQMQAAIDRMEAAARALGKPQSLAEARRFGVEQRRWFNAEPPALARVEDRTIDGPSRAVPVRLYVPRGAPAPMPAIVYFHGGGWFSCSNETHDRILRLLARAANAAVIGVDYCLAPEHKFPHAVEEAGAALASIAAAGGAWGLDTRRLAFGGCSAGANIALGAMLSLPRDVAQTYRAGALFYGAYDPALDSDSSRQFGAEGAWLSVKEMQWCWKTYLAAEADRADPRAAPLCASDAALKALPPLHLCAAGLDPLRDDTIRLARRLACLGVPHALSVRERLGHSFLGFARMVDEARAALDEAGEFLNRHWAQAANTVGRAPVSRGA